MFSIHSTSYCHFYFSDQRVQNNLYNFETFNNTLHYVNDLIRTILHITIIHFTILHNPITYFLFLQSFESYIARFFLLDSLYKHFDSIPTGKIITCQHCTSK